MIEVLKGFPERILGLACKGHVTRLDYQTVLVPTVEKALEKPGNIRLYYQLGPDFTGMDAGAVWEDLEIGVEHLRRWERVAVVTDVEWIKRSIQMFGFLMPGRVKVFPITAGAEARAWITGT